MRRFWGTLGGAALGLLGGPAGIFFGAAIGLLVDLTLTEQRAARAAVAFLEHSTRPGWLPAAVPLAGVLLGRLHAEAPSDVTINPGPVADRLRAYFPDRFARRIVERMIAEGVGHTGLAPGRFTTLMRTHLELDDRRRVFVAVWEVIREQGSSALMHELVGELAYEVGLAKTFVDEELIPRPLLDEAACRVLGVERTADEAEVRSAYRRLASQFHPDTATALTDAQRLATEDAFKRITAAYETLRSELNAGSS